MHSISSSRQGSLRPSATPTAVPPLRTLAAAICSVLGLGASSLAWAATPSQIIADGKTGTVVTSTGAAGSAVFGVTTPTVNGSTAFNSFTNFNVVKGDTVNLTLPGTTTNLVNLVWNAQASINGTVTSYLNGGTTKKGGAVYFADPYGIVVGSTGVLNVGALSLSAPTMQFMDSLLDTNGNVNPASSAVTTLLQGQEPLADNSGTCLICVAGQVNATNAVRIRATAIDVSGTIYVSGNGTDTLSTAVNVDGSSTPTVVVDGNTIRLMADDSNTAAVGDAVTNSTINVSGTLQTASVAQPNGSAASASSWGQVAVTAEADSTSSYSTGSSNVLFAQAGTLFHDQNDFFQNGIASSVQDANLAAGDSVGEVAYVRAFSTASVNIGGTINAGGNVLLQSNTLTSATTAATTVGSNGSSPVMISAMYGAVYSKANTSIASGANVTSGGQLSVQSSTNNTLNVAASTEATDASNFAATTVAWSQAAVDAEATVNGAVNANSLDIGAHNTNSFTTSASATASNSTGSVGLAGAVSLQTVVSNAALDSSPAVSKGNITVASETDDTANSTSASTATAGPSDNPGQEESGANADLSATLTGKTGIDSSGASTFASKVPFKLGSAVAWTDSDNSATATIGNNVTINTAGNVAVHATVNDTGIHNGADSDTESDASAADEGSSGSDGSSGGGSPTTVNVSAAVAYGNYQHQADAEIGTDDNITAANIGVGSQVLVPFDWTFGLSTGDLSPLLQMGNSLDDFVTGAQALPGLITQAKAIPQTIGNGASGYASASSTDASGDIGGQVNYFAMSNTDRAWVGDGSVLKTTASTAATPGADSWQTTLDWGTTPITWAHSLNVTANTAVAAFNLVGDITPWSSGTDGDDAAVGGAFNYGGYENSTVAGVGSNASLTSSNDAAVTALSQDTLFVLSPVSGTGGTGSLQGTVAVTDVDDHTHATLSASDMVTARALDVTATNPLMIWSLSGAIAMSNQASVGISVGINDLTTDTLASIGNNSADEVITAADQSAPPTPVTGLAETGGVLAVSSLSVLGTSSGESGMLSVAGSSVSDKSGDDSGSSGSSGSSSSSSDASAPPSGSGSSLIGMLQSVQSVADKLRGASDTLNSALTDVDELTGASSTGSSLLDQASNKLQSLSNGDQTLQTIVGKATSISSASGGSSSDSSSGGSSGGGSSGDSSEPPPEFGLGISGAAGVNLAQLNTRAALDGVTVDDGSTGTNVAIQAINNAQLGSIAGGAALSRAKTNTGGDLGGAVAYSSVADTTAATVANSTLTNAPTVVVNALDGSEQIAIGIGAAVQTGSTGDSATLAGSVSVATSANQTTATISNSTLNGGTGTDRSLAVNAYDDSRIGIGAGSLAVNTGSGSSANGALGFTYSSIADQTSTDITGHTGSATVYDINNYDRLSANALDSSEIAAAVATGTYSPNGSGLSGSFIWNQVANSSVVDIDGGMRIKTAGVMQIQADAVDASDASVASLVSAIDAPASSSGYDFSGTTLAFSGTQPSGSSGSGTPIDTSQPDTSSLTSSGWGSSIIAVAGDINVGKNNVGLSFVGSQVSNTHQVSIGDAALDAGGAIGIQAEDDTRILSLAVGVGVSTGQFAGLGSATYNHVTNQDQILLGSQVASSDTASLQATSIDSQAQDSSAIYSLAGNVAISKGNGAASGAVTYNDIANTVNASAGATSFDTGTGAVTLDASDDALVMAGAVAGAASKGTSLALSFGWNQTADVTSAMLDNGSLVTAGNLGVTADNASNLYALTGSVGIGGQAAVGLAASVANIGDSTAATAQNVGLDLSGNGQVTASGSGQQYTLGVAGAFGGDGAGAGSVTYNTINDTIAADASQLYGVSSGAAATNAVAQADNFTVSAQNNAAISSLAGGIGIGGDAGIGAAVSVSTVGGSTSAALTNSVLSVTQDTDVSAVSNASINSISVAGAVGGSVAVSGSNTTNIISNSIAANMTDVGTGDGSTDGSNVDSTNNTSVTATNNASINALAGAVSGSGSAAVGAAVAVNQISTTTDASFLGGVDNRTYKTEQLLVSAGASNPDATSGGSDANINAIAVGAAGGGDVGVAGSVAVDLLSGGTDARIDQGANVIANSNVGVLASNDQGINVLAGAAAVGGTAGIGVGVVVNSVGSTTNAGIYGSNVTAYGNDNALSVDSGTPTNASTLDSSLDLSGSTTPGFISNPSAYVAPNLSSTQTQVHGVAVNASNQQSIATLGVGVTLAGSVAVNALAGVNEVGGTTSAVIQNANINQADLIPGSTTGGVVSAPLYANANADQQVDVRASSRQYEANMVANVAAAGAVAVDGAVATNIFDASTTASILNTTASSQAATTVSATGNQWSLAGAMGAAASGSVGGAASASVSIFSANTDALVDGGSFNVGSFNVLANNATRGSQLGGAIGFGAGVAGVAGVAIVNVDSDETSATVQDGAQIATDGNAVVQATSSNDQQDVAVGAAAGTYAGIAGGAVVNVIANSTHASIDNSMLTAASVAVNANDTQSLNAYSGVLGGGFVGIGGGINLSLLQASVGAGVLDSTVDATYGGVTVDATSTRNVTSVAASAGVGAVGVGLSAGVIVAGSGDISDGGTADSQGNLNASGQVNLGNLSNLADGSRVDSNVSDYGLSSSQLDASSVQQINTAGSYNLGNATGTDAASFGASDGIQSLVSGGTMTAQQGVAITANVSNSTSNTAGGFAAGAVAVGGSLAYTTLNTDIQASVATGTSITAGNGITISATSANASGGPAVSTNAIAGAGGLVAASAAVSISDVNNSVTASDGGTLTAGTSGQGTLAVLANDSSTSSAGNANANVSVGAIVAGTVVVDALRSSTVDAAIAANTTTSGFSLVNVAASDTGSASSQAVMGVGGLLDAVSGVVANASDSSTVTASIGAGADISAANTTVNASATPSAFTSAEGITVAGVAGIGANIADADVSDNVQALVGNNAVFGSGNLGVMASITPTVNASTTGGAGAALVGANAAVSDASDDSTVLANIGNNVVLPNGNVTIAAASSTTQTSSAQSITAAGILAVGAADATSSSTLTTTASLGDGNGAQQATLGNLVVIATGQDTNDASSTAGSGGLISGNASLATTQSTATTSATIGQNLDLDQLANFSLTATHTSLYGGAANSTNAAAVGASGANVDNSAASTTLTSIGNSSTVATQDDLYVSAQSKFASDANNGGASGGAGGIVAGEAAGVSTVLTANNTTQVGTLVNLAAGLNPNDDPLGNLTLLSDTVINGLSDQASLSVYGAVPIADAVADLQGTFDSSLTIGNGSNLSSNGRVDIATYANVQKIGNSASANTGGIATVGTADATIDLTSNQTVAVGNNVTISSIGEADIVAGKDIVNSADTELNPSVIAQAYIRGLIAIPHASATADTTSNATLTLGTGSQVIGGGDVAIGSMSGTTLVQTDGTGHGYELGFIPATQSSNNQSNIANATTTINGSVLAGKFDTININIDANGNLTDTGSSSPYQYVKYNANCSTVGGATGACFNPTAYLNAYYGTPSQTTYQGFDNTDTGAFILGGTLAQQNGITYGNDLYVSGGNVYLYGSSIAGNGSVTANGAPSITIENASPDYLILPGMQVSFGSTGSVIVAGGADPNHLGNIDVTQTPSSAQPTITINSSYGAGGGATPGIVLLNEIDNLGGSVTINDSAGSLIESPIHANAVTVTAPNGGIVFNQPSQNWISDSDSVSSLGTSGSWLNSFLNTFVTSADNTAAAIANAVYGNGATNTASLNSNLLNYDNDPQAQKTPVVLYGYCAPYAQGGCGGDSGWATTGIISGQSVDTVPYIALSQSGNFANDSASSGSYESQTLSVTANFININSAIYVGTPATWTVQTTTALSTWMSQQTGGNPIAIPTVDANGNPLLQVINAGSELIGASYNPSTNQILLNNVNASGGGQAYFDGKIVSTGNGSIHVNSGFGQVVVDNTTGDPLVVNDIYTGSGGLGLITMTDTLNTLPGNVPRTTWYVSQNGGAAVAYDNSNGATTWQNGALVGAVTSTTAYQPLQGEEYTWSASTSVNREGSSHWSWGAEGDGTAGQHWDIGSSQFVGAGDSGYANLNGNDYLVSLSGQFTDMTGEDIWYHGCGGGLGSGCHYSTTATGFSSDQNSWHSQWDFLYPTAGTLTLNFTQRADMPIDIAFSTNQSNRVEIDSNSNILLNGVISNTNAPSNTSLPDTLLQATNGGSILQNSSSALIWTHDLSMVTTGGGSIGTATAPIQARIVHDSTPGSTLSANTDGGDIYVNVDSGNSDQAISAIAKGVNGSGTPIYGDVSITGTGSLVGIAGNTRDVIGDDVTLISTLGSIGTLATPLNVETHPEVLYNGSLSNGSLNAQALGDVSIDDFGGDVWVGSIVSDTGSVALSAPDGGIYDARLLSPATSLSATQAQAIWSRLQLNSSGAAQTIADALQNQVNAAYSDYWQLLSVGSVSNGVFTLNANALALYQQLALADAAQLPSGLTTAELTQAYVNARYNNDASLFTTYIGSNWQSTAAFTSQQSAYSFVIASNSTLYQSLVANTQWSSDQLTYAINVAALAAPSGAQVGTVAPNISGNNITLTAGAGGIGSTAAPISINYSDFQNLFTSGVASQALQNDVLALGMANTPGDIVLLDAHGNVLQPNGANTTADLATISIAQTNPLYLQATGAVSGSASATVFVQANGNLNLGGLTSGGDMRLAATGSIDAATGRTTGQAALTSGGNLVINAGGGAISFGDGTDATHPGDALSVQIDGSLLNASASTNLLLRQISGNLTIGSVFANGEVSLAAPSGSILGTLTGLSIEGNNIDLSAADDIGQRVAVSTGVDAPLQVQVGSSGLLNATAGGAVNIESPVTALQVGTIVSGNDLTVTATQAALTAQQLTSNNGAVSAAAGTDGDITSVQAATGATLTAAGRLDVGSVDSTSGDITLDAATGMSLQSANASSGNVFVNLVGGGMPAFVIDSNGSVQAGSTIDIESSGSLTMDQGSQMGAVGAVTLNSSGDMQLGSVQSLASTGTAIDVNAGGAISSNGAAINLQAREGGATLLQAVDDIGSATSPIVVDVNALSGTSTTGNVWLHALGDISVSSFTTPMGNLSIAADQTLNYITLQSSGSTTLSATQIDGGQLTAGTSAQLTSSGSTTVDTVQTGTDLAINAGTTLDATTLNIGGNGDLASGTAMTLGTTTAVGDINATAGTDLTAATLTSTSGSATLTATQGDLDVTGSLGTALNAALASGGDTTINAMTVGGALLSNSGGDTHIVQGTVAGTSQLTAGGMLTIDSLQAANDVTTQSVGDTHLGDVVLSGGSYVGNANGNFNVTQLLNVQNGNANLSSGADMNLLSVTTSGDLTAQAGGNLNATTLDAGGVLLSNSGGDTHIVQGTVAGTSQLTAGGMLTIDSLQAANDVTTQSVGDTHLGDVVLSGGSYVGNANGNFNVTQLLNVQNGNANLSSGADMNLLSVTTSGDLTAQAGGNLNATTLNAGGAVTLASAQAMTLGTTTAVGDINATAGTDLTAATLSSTSGNATLTATQGDLDVTGSLGTALNATLVSGGDITINAMTVGGGLLSNSGGDTHIVQGTVTGTSQLTAGGMLTIDNLQAANNVTTQSAGDTDLGDVVLSGGSYKGNANAEFNVTQLLNVQSGNANLSSGTDMNLLSVTTSGNLTAQAGGNLNAATLDAGGTATLTSAQAMTLGTTTAVGDINATAGTDLTAATLSSASGNATLTATQGDLDVTGSLGTALNTTLASGGDTTINAMTVGGALLSNSGGDTHIVQGTVAGTSQLTAGGMLTIDSLQAGNNVTTQSTGDTNLANVVLSDGLYQGNAGGNFNVTQWLDVQNGSANIQAAANIDLAQVTTAGVLTAQAAGNLQSNILQIGTNGQLNAGGSIALLGATTAGNDLSMTADGHLGFAGINVGQNVFGQSVTDGIDGNSVVAGGSIDFVAAKWIHIGNLQAGTDVDLQAGTDISTQTVNAGHDVNVTAGTDVNMFSTQAGNQLSVNAGGALTVHDMQAGHTIDLAASQITFASLSAPDSITLLARDGNILGTELTTRDAFVSASGDIALDAAFIGDRINLAATDINANITQTSTGQPLYSVLTGYQGGVAQRITVDAGATQQWMIDRLSAVQAALATTAARADIQSGHIEQTLSLDTSVAKVRMNQQSAYLVPANVQLMQPSYDFLLYQDGIHTLTDAFVVRYDFGYQIQTPNFIDDHLWAAPDYLGESALRFNGRYLTEQAQIDSDVSVQRSVPTWVQHDSSKLVQPVDDGVAVNLKAPSAPE